MNTLDAAGILRQHLLGRREYAARKSGTRVAFRCPEHHDSTASAWLGDHAWGCSACGFSRGLSSLAEKLGVEIPAATGSGLTVAEDAETTVECNPGTVTRGKLEDYRALGVNRLSFGVQSFHDEELKFLTRIHSADQARAAIEELLTVIGSGRPVNAAMVESLTRLARLEPSLQVFPGHGATTTIEPGGVGLCWETNGWSIQPPASWSRLGIAPNTCKMGSRCFNVASRVQPMPTRRPCLRFWCWLLIHL